MEDPIDVGDGGERLASQRYEVVAGLQPCSSGYGIRSDRLDARDSVRHKGEADGLGGGPGIDQVRRDDFLFVPIVTAEGLPNLVAVDAAWDNFAFPIEFDFVSPGETRNLQRRFERDSFTLLAGQRRL